MLWWLIVVVTLTTLVVLCVNGYGVIVLSAEEERGRGALPKAVAALSLSCACFLVLLPPLQLAIQSEFSDLSIIVQNVVLGAWGTCTFVFVPFAMFHYELSEQDSACRRLMTAFTYTAVLLTVVMGSAVGLWFVSGSVTTDSGLVQSPLTTYVFSLLTAGGWVMFALFGAVGIVAVPLNGIRSFVNRPRPMEPGVYHLTRARLHAVTARLLEDGKALASETACGNPTQKQRRKLFLFRRELRELEDEYSKTEESHRLTTGSALQRFVMLLLSLVALALSIALITEVICNAVQVTGLLDTFLVALAQLVPMLATTAYSVLALYLLVCSLAGCWTLGSYLPVVPVFDMRLRATLLNALLFNVLLIMVNSTAVVHLCYSSFPHYLSDSQSTSVWKELAKCTGIREVLLYAPLVMLGLVPVAAIGLLVLPKPAVQEDEEEVFLV